MKRKSSLYLKDILTAIQKIDEFIEGMNFEQFLEDDKTSSAVIRKLEIIGEAVKQLPPEIRERYSEIPWAAMAKSRDKIIHFYHGIDYEIIWQIIKEDLPRVKEKLQQIYLQIVKEEQRG